MHPASTHMRLKSMQHSLLHRSKLFGMLRAGKEMEWRLETTMAYITFLPVFFAFGEGGADDKHRS
jgi:hypothetical protein